MKHFILILSLFLSTTTFASTDVNELADENRICYGKARIGFDFVINSRLGMLPEKGVALVGYGTPRAEFYLESILGAYLWEDTAHKYAEKVFTKCVKNKEDVSFLK